MLGVEHTVKIFWRSWRLVFCNVKQQRYSM